MLPAVEAEPGPAHALSQPPRSAHLPGFPSQIDFCAGIAAQARAIEAGERPFFSGNRALHITELALALNNAAGLGAALCGEEHVLRLMAHVPPIALAGSRRNSTSPRGGRRFLNLSGPPPPR